MSTLADHVDRIAQLAQSISSNASVTGTSPEDPYAASGSAGPFVRAMLETPLGNLIRDTDPAELGLFTLVSPAAQHTTMHASTQGREATVNAQRAEIARAEFIGATPLRKPPAPRREDPQRPREHEPEVYAHAALKYLDKYQSIRPMPRASEQATNILDRLVAVRKNIHDLNEHLKQRANTDPVASRISPPLTMTDEEQRIADLQCRIAELKKRREMLQHTRPVSRNAPKVKPKQPSPSRPSTPSAQEESFWNTPAASTRILHFTGDFLMDEQVDLADVSTISFASPIPVSRHPSGSASHPISPSSQWPLGERVEVEEGDVGEVDIGSPQDHHHISRDDDDDDPATDLHADYDALEQLQNAKDPIPGSSQTWKLPALSKELSSPVPEASLPATTKPRLKMTTEMEHAVARIWATIGEIIMPGNSYETYGTGRNKPPHAKETLAHLRTLSTQEAGPLSPTTSLSSLSQAASTGQPTAQQILTAHMLLALLESPPHYAMPLNRLKEVLSSKAGNLRGTAVTRPIYGCVAKRLLRIERGGGEQVVKFDV